MLKATISLQVIHPSHSLWCEIDGVVARLKSGWLNHGGSKVLPLFTDGMDRNDLSIERQLDESDPRGQSGRYRAIAVST